ncbi:solute carrier family 2, facilitated glucose transporter member 2-like [Helicoverpa zea]|uniref:solute carrier family 2, facilitated glucose transporter member 2-like n=1 Tax=Helicoverpa zea TaxID=7113 RepID=UPI001F561CE7|nr:solute carrier family 2, facilitated glucose transporter member 2-like [Helicoverpa zea]
MVYTISGNGNNNRSVEKSEQKWCLWKEVVLAVLVNIPFFTNGVETTMLSSSAHSGNFVSHNGTQWTTAAMVVGAGASAPVMCYIIDAYGRMSGVFLVSMVQGITLIPHFLLNKNNMYPIEIVLHILSGISSGGLFTVLPIYLREITTLRGFSLTLMMAMTTAGYMTKIISIEVRLYLILGLVMVQFLSILMMVESPSYLVMVKKYEKARKNLSKLRVVTEDDPHVSLEISNLKAESDKAKTVGKLSVRTVWRNKIWLDGTKIGVVLYTLTAICGSILFLDQQKTLMQLRVSSDPERMLVVSTLLLGSIFCLVCSTFVDRKYLLTAGYVTMTLSTGVLAVYTQADLTVTSLRWLPVTALGMLVFAYGIVWGLPVVIMVEVFNLEIRATLIGTIYAYSQIIKLFHVQTFQYIEDYIGVYTTFYIFACINLFGVVYTLFAVPNIRNKSVRQIERQLKRPALPA